MEKKPMIIANEQWQNEQHQHFQPKTDEVNEARLLNEQLAKQFESLKQSNPELFDTLSLLWRSAFNMHNIERKRSTTPKYVSTKTYGHERGYAVAYRQWRADSHCRLIHGYSLSFYLEFESETVDVRNWVVDFGSLKTFKDFLDDNFDHVMLVAQDDPEFETFKMLHDKKLCKMVVVERTGCEGLSKFLYDYLNEIWLPQNGYSGVHCRLVKVAETPANSAWYEGTK